jgi:hypothetical protein
MLSKILFESVYLKFLNRFSLVLILLILTLQYNSTYAKVIVKNALNNKDKVDELESIMPILNPIPCSVFLVDFGSTIDEVKLMAKNKGINLDETDSTRLVYQISESKVTIDYEFEFNNQGKYTGFGALITYKLKQNATNHYKNLKKILNSKWGKVSKMDSGDLGAIKECMSDGKEKFIMLSGGYNNGLYLYLSPSND